MYEPKPTREGGFVFTYAAKPVPEATGCGAFHMNSLRSWFFLL
jgi:hypothetical protein